MVCFRRPERPESPKLPVTVRLAKEEAMHHDAKLPSARRGGVGPDASPMRVIVVDMCVVIFV